jgi:hypothetical protein
MTIAIACVLKGRNAPVRAQNCAVEAEPGRNLKCFRAPRNRALALEPEAARARKNPESYPAILSPVFSVDELYQQRIPDGQDSRRLLWIVYGRPSRTSNATSW